LLTSQKCRNSIQFLSLISITGEFHDCELES
jgi:hypothetical protein